jgi:hypothetical protein
MDEVSIYVFTASPAASGFSPDSNSPDSYSPDLKPPHPAIKRPCFRSVLKLINYSIRRGEPMLFYRRETASIENGYCHRERLLTASIRKNWCERRPGLAKLK